MYSNEYDKSASNDLDYNYDALLILISNGCVMKSFDFHRSQIYITNPRKRGFVFQFYCAAVLSHHVYR